MGLIRALVYKPMDIWSFWLDAIRSLLHFLASDLGLGVGLAIVALTVATRALLLPLTWSIGYRGCVRQRKMALLQPQLKRLKDELVHDPKRYMEELKQLYAGHGLTFVDGRSLFALLAQTPILLGLYQTIRGAGGGGRFLWIQSLAKPDIAFAVIVAGTTAMLMAANPDLPEQLRLLMIVIPALLAFITALKFCSALALYFAASNCLSAAQTYCLHAVVARRIKSGSLVI